MKNQFGNKIKELRESKGLLQRQVASLLEIDTPMLSKIERGERKAKKEQVKQLSAILKNNLDELQTLWLADQVYEMVKNEKVADSALKSVSKNIKTNRK
jgi:transcriptional regulator with XRE-family HTH domain